MREIKFRAWNTLKTTVGMSPGVTMSEWLSTYAKLGADATDKYHVFMQSTGVNDMDGREIYEGDIVQRYHTSGQYIVKDSVRVVAWRVSKTGVGFNIGETGNSRLKVIGNIYENPELLEK